MSVWIGDEELDLPLTLMGSAQCFHWTQKDGRFGAVLDGKPVWLWQEGESIFAADGADKAFLRRYLDLDRDYSSLRERWDRYPQVREALNLFPGLRVLRQGLWETLFSFILSANNNVSRIRMLTVRLCEAYGERFETAYGALYGFPPPETLRRVPPARLREAGVGYRDRFLTETAAMVSDGFLPDNLAELSYEDAHARLVQLPGVGDKVADCVQLFGCGQTEAFPVDVWMARICEKVFHMEGSSRRKIAAQARDLLGKDAGLLQQFLFHAARTGAVKL